MTSEEKVPDSIKVSERRRPLLLAGASGSSHERTTELPTVLTAILMDWSMDTPFPSKVPRVREKRAVSYLNTTFPASGSFNSVRSDQALPAGDASQLRKP